jgi:hypothetical protein
LIPLYSRHKLWLHSRKFIWNKFFEHIYCSIQFFFTVLTKCSLAQYAPPYICVATFIYGCKLGNSSEVDDSSSISDTDTGIQLTFCQQQYCHSYGCKLGNSSEVDDSSSISDTDTGIQLTFCQQQYCHSLFPFSSLPIF